MAQQASAPDPNTHCPRCQQSWHIPPDLSLAVWEEASTFIQAKPYRFTNAVSCLGQHGISVADAVKITRHMTRTAGLCRQCEQPLDGREVTVCTNCGALAYDWLEYVTVE